MTETSSGTTDIKAQYTAQVAADLERNAKEQERLRGEIDALQNQLEALRLDHTVLLNMRTALGTAATSTPAPSAEEVAAPSVPRQKTAAKAKGLSKKAPTEKATAEKATAKKAPAKKATSPRGSGTAKATTTASATATTSKAAKPTLVELIRRHLNEQSEPRSAAEVATALSQSHPDRRIQTNVVRTTLEGLVAKSHAQRTKQGSSVFYTTPDTQESTTEPQGDAQPEEAGK